MNNTIMWPLRAAEQRFSNNNNVMAAAFTFTLHVETLLGCINFNGAAAAHCRFF